MPAPPAPADDPAPAPIPMAPTKKHPLLGKTLARCVVGDRVGRGATSSVYRARYTRLDRDVALKVLGGDRAGDAEARTRFIDEAKSVAKVTHENIVKVLDVVEDQGYLCILMELVDGETVQDLLDDHGPLPPKRALKVALDVARALEAAHEEEIVHRDIKPANFIVERGTGLVKVVDFGLAAKGANNRVGTPLYMSPEAAQGKRIDEKSDVYGLGVSLYQMLTGQHPFAGSTVKDILAAHVNEEPIPPSKVKPDLGTKYDALLAKLLVKAKGYRPSSADVVALLEPLVDEPRKEHAGRKPAAKRPAAAAKKSQMPMMLGIGGVVVVIVVAAVLLNGKSEPPPAPPTVKPAVVAPPVDPNALGRQAYTDAETWAAANRDDVEGIVRRWAAVERDTAGTDWAKKASDRRADAEKARDKRRADDAEKARDDAARAERDAKRNDAYSQIPKLIADFDFEGAAAKVREYGAPQGTPQKEWYKRATRLEALDKDFVRTLDARLKESPVRASKVNPAAAPDEQIVGATRDGLITDLAGKTGRIAWAQVKPVDLVKGVVKRALGAKAEDQLLIALLAAELSRPDLTEAERTSLAKESNEARQMVDLMDKMGEVKDRLKDLFVTEQDTEIKDDE